MIMKGGRQGKMVKKENKGINLVKKQDRDKAQENKVVEDK